LGDDRGVADADEGVDGLVGEGGSE